MGAGASASTNFPRDAKIEKISTQLNMPDAKIHELYRIFQKYDRENTGFMQMEDYFNNVIQVPRNVM